MEFPAASLTTGVRRSRNTYAACLFQPVFERDYGQLDGSLLYTVFDHYKIGVQASNLLAQTAILQIGQTVAGAQNYQWVQGERKFSLVMRATWYGNIRKRRSPPVSPGGFFFRIISS